MWLFVYVATWVSDGTIMQKLTVLLPNLVARTVYSHEAHVHCETDDEQWPANANCFLHVALKICPTVFHMVPNSVVTLRARV